MIELHWYVIYLIFSDIKCYQETDIKCFFIYDSYIYVCVCVCVCVCVWCVCVVCVCELQ